MKGAFNPSSKQTKFIKSNLRRLSLKISGKGNSWDWIKIYVLFYASLHLFPSNLCAIILCWFSMVFSCLYINKVYRFDEISFKIANQGRTFYKAISASEVWVIFFCEYKRAHAFPPFPALSSRFQIKSFPIKKIFGRSFVLSILWIF